MRKNRNDYDSDALDAYDERLIEENPSRLRSIIFFLLCTMLIVSTIAYGAVDPWATALLSIFAGLIVLLWLGYSFFSREWRFSTNLLQLPLLGLLLISFIQLLPLRSADVSTDLLSIPAVSSLSLDPYATRLFIVQLCVYLVFFAACLTFLENERRQRIIVFTIITFASVMAFFGIIQSLTNTNPNTILGMRESPGAFPFATFVNRHHFAAFMNMGIGVTLGLLYGKSTKQDKRLLLIIALVLMGIAMMFTGSRGGILSLLGVVGFVILLNLTVKKHGDASDGEERNSFRLSKNFLLIGSGLLLILILIGSASFFGGESSVVRSIGLDSQSDISNGRGHFWKTTLQIILHNPIFGVGFDAFGMAFTRYDTWNGTLRIEQAHNEYLQMLAEGGILGFACLAAFIYFLFKQGLRIIRRSEDRFRSGVAVGALAGCFGILIHSFFDFPLRTPSNAFFFLTLASLATIATFYSPVSRKRRRHAAEED
jgi:O-antigen ligase